MTRVKICGCRSVEQALAAAEAGADFVGLMFAPSSRRRVELEDASEIVRALGTPLRGPGDGHAAGDVSRRRSTDLRSWFEHGASALERMLERKRPLTVGVFADNDPDEINEIVDECGIDLIQLSGGEPWGACLLANRQVIKALHVRADDTASSALGTRRDGQRDGRAAGHAPTMQPSAAPDRRSTGAWRRAIAARMPVWLAGGLTPENVAAGDRDGASLVRRRLQRRGDGRREGPGEDPRLRRGGEGCAMTQPSNARTDVGTELQLGPQRPVRQPRPRLAGFDYKGRYAYHVVLTVKTRSEVFADLEFGRWSASQLAESARLTNFDVLAYCFMPDHTHLLIQGTEDSSFLVAFVQNFKQRTAFRFQTRIGRPVVAAELLRSRAERR